MKAAQTSGRSTVLTKLFAASTAPPNFQGTLSSIQQLNLSVAIFYL